MGGRRRITQIRDVSTKGRMPTSLPIVEDNFRRVSVDELFQEVNEFAAKKREHTETLEEAQSAINKIYHSFSQQERVRFFSMLYDRFAERYDEHMGIETRHYQAIERVMGYAAPYFRYPILDVTAGTGEPLKYALELIAMGRRMRELGIPNVLPVQDSDLVIANEISPRMIQQAKRKLSGVSFSESSAYDMPADFNGRFATVICSQTFHLISDEDKPRLVRSIRDSLAPGGIAVIIEEDPFRISQTAPIEAVSLFLRAIVRPIKHRGTLIAFFENEGLNRIEERAVAPIDSEHVMRLHLFQKPVTQV